MSQPLPRLRMNLDFMPSPMEDRPGLLIRDSYGYSDAVLIVPPPLVACLEFFDGQHTDLDLKEMLVRLTGELDVAPILDGLSEALGAAGFLHDETYEALREHAERDFAEAALREASHAGSAYPDDPATLRETLSEYMKGPESEAEGSDLIAIVAPHVSPFGGWESYREAYSALGEAHRDRVFVILGTSHYGEPDCYGLTRKPYVTPYGTVRPELDLINELAVERAVKMEDYCHAIEHSIEFQILFLQHLYGPDVRVLPILVGSYARSIHSGGLPEENEGVARFLGKLGEIGAREGNKLLWVLGIDMAHMGARYGDEFEAQAKLGRMNYVEERDKARIDRVNAADARGFWDLVQENRDDLKWCGSSPLYTFLRAMPNARGSLRRYDQWNIDDRSVVSFGAMSFRPA
ncbi:MAG: AmmeMemoRadiSam system protein B [Bryobacteraceae bacterium]|nr:AmmeMemoRadiSam system protein B [Bryobacteraceae bacterium]